MRLLSSVETGLEIWYEWDKIEMGASHVRFFETQLATMRQIGKEMLKEIALIEMLNWNWPLVTTCVTCCPNWWEVMLKSIIHFIRQRQFFLFISQFSVVVGSFSSLANQLNQIVCVLVTTDTYTHKHHSSDVRKLIDMCIKCDGSIRFTHSLPPVRLKKAVWL